MNFLGGASGRAARLAVDRALRQLNPVMVVSFGLPTSLRIASLHFPHSEPLAAHRLHPDLPLPSIDGTRTEVRRMTHGTIVVEPLIPVIGAEIGGVDLGQPLDDENLQLVHNAWMDHLILVFRDQALDLPRLDALGRQFGELHVHPADPGVDGYPGILKIHHDADSAFHIGRIWHSDVSSDREPPMGSILHLHQVPQSGGDTLFANMYTAFDALSESMKSWLSTLVAVHSSAKNDRDYFGVTEEDLRDGDYPEFAHPVVRTHPETGRKALFVNQIFTTHIVGLEPRESQAILDFLYGHIAEPRFQCRVRWRTNSVVFWDNRCAQHMAMWDYYPRTRSRHRVTIAGDRPV